MLLYILYSLRNEEEEQEFIKKAKKDQKTIISKLLRELKIHPSWILISALHNILKYRLLLKSKTEGKFIK